MEHKHIITGKLHLLFVENVAVLHTDVIFLVEETLSLDTCHVENIKLRHRLIQVFDLFVLDSLCIQCILNDIIRDAQFRRGNEDETDACVAGQRID